MARGRKVCATKYQIIQVATQAFLEKGYSDTSIRFLANELDISPGHLMFYFPTKEHLLAVLVEMLCKFQWKQVKEIVEEGNTSLMAVCMELASMTAACEEDEIIKDFFLASYRTKQTLELIRQNDLNRAKLVFGEYCPEWTDQDFAEAEILVSGIEYATLMQTDDSVSLDVRVEGALNQIMLIYQVPEETRRFKIGKILSMDYRGVSRTVLSDFKSFVQSANEHSAESLLLG